MHPSLATLLVRLHRFATHHGGTTAIMAAIMFPVVIGGLGLGAETGYWYMTQRKLQHVADVSAHAAGTRLRADDTDEQVIAAARLVASQSGYTGTPELTVDPHYTSDAHPGAMLVEVVATDVQPRLFSAVVAGFFSRDPQLTVTMSARAVAEVDLSEASRACVLALATTASRAVTMQGSTSISLEGCDIASNSNAGDALYVTSSATSGCAFSVGRAYTPGLQLTQCVEVKENAPLIRDPYAHVVEPANPGNCKNRNQGHPNNATQLTPGCYSGLTVKGPVHFQSGVYYIDGGEFNVNAGDNSKLTGTGVTIYLANGARLNIGGSIQVNFSAPTNPANPYAGIVFFGARNATATTHSLAGGSGSDYTGAIYAPASHIQFTGNSKATGGGCTQLVGARVTFTGNSSLKSTCQAAGTTEIATNEMVSIVE